MNKGWEFLDRHFFTIFAIFAILKILVVLAFVGFVGFIGIRIYSDLKSYAGAQYSVEEKKGVDLKSQQQVIELYEDTLIHLKEQQEELKKLLKGELTNQEEKELQEELSRVKKLKERSERDLKELTSVDTRKPGEKR